MSALFPPIRVSGPGGGAPVKAASPAPGGVLRVVSTSISAAQMATLFTAPIMLVAPPGAGRIVLPMFMYMEVNLTVLFGTNPSINVRWAGSAPANPALLAPTAMGWNTSANRKATRVQISGAQFNYDTSFDPINQGLYLSTTSDLGGVGNATGGITMTYINIPSFV